MIYEQQPTLPAPANSVGFVGWLRKNLFNSVGNGIATVVLGYFVIGWLASIIDWAFLTSDWFGSSREDCTSGGACWVFITYRLDQFLYGFYPAEETWRLDLVFVAFMAQIAWLVWPNLPKKGMVAAFLLLVFPIIAFFLLTGGAFGLLAVETHKWGGLSLTLIIAVVGIVASLPLGVLLALGRRSDMPIVRSFCVAYIEVWRGVPLISVLFMASVMLPLFFPEDLQFDKLLRALIGITMFQTAYMAEVIRGGLQAIPKGQYEAADALGLGYWQKMIMIILPQALKLMIPGVVNTFIALFKDTTLVLIIGLFDILAIVQAANADPKWVGYEVEGYVFVAFVFFIFCFGMSRYSQHLEKLLHTGHGNRA